MSPVLEIDHRNSNDQKAITFKHILTATDFSDVSGRALNYASAMACRYGSRISVVHVLPPDPHEPFPIYPLPPELDRRQLDAQRKMQLLGISVAGLQHQMRIEHGRVWDVLDSLIQRENIDLLVLGSSGRGGMKKLALGSVAEEVLRRAPCPVLIVGPNVPALGSGTARFSRILFATDFGDSCYRAFQYALGLAEDCCAKLVLVYIVPPMPVPELGPVVYCPGAYLADTLVKWEERERVEGLKKLRALLPANSNLPAPPEFVVETGLPPEGILRAAASSKAELIVMGARRTPTARAAAHSPWGLTHEVICQARCPVLTVGN